MRKAFKSHLERIKFAKNAASLWEQMALAEKSMGILWEQLFDSLCSNTMESDWSSVKDLSGILHKLLQNYQQLFAITQKLQSDASDEKAWNLSENVLKTIEDQLQLL